jgi:hypothetical protein
MPTHVSAFPLQTAVRERGTNIIGRIVGRGAHPGEWKVEVSAGIVVMCLDVNLVPVDPAENMSSRRRQM